ncbi:XrtA/PEP-CTERM system-associated ATPase [Flocculibacter collagenilyticus]|uniref:XrtA/PEP-CTERM system-associated ATPase n=1 Tax=Flocculibacter collagenilyticus TaxID=2744479 RepID=UPI0018F6E223|nr:XrtA/PEP-CTERM system-associated ATPase [Flocculibacter collagenilyticus]
MYESFFGLTEKPFQLTPDPNVFFASKLHKRALSYLQYGLSQAEGFIVIAGDIGTGKTTIANHLIAQVPKDEVIAKQIVTPKLSPDDLVKMVAAVFNLQPENDTKVANLNAIELFLKRLHAQQRKALLIVDEAQNLPLESIEELRMLSNFQINGQPLIQSFLLGQNELKDIIQAPNMEQFRQRIIASCHLSSLSEDELAEYIEYRLKHAGWDQGELFTNDAYSAIYQFTQGIPRKINTFVDRVLLFAFLEDIKHIDAEAIAAVRKEMGEEMAHQAAPLTNDGMSNISSNNGSDDNVLTLNTGQLPDQRYKEMLLEMVEILDNSVEHKIKLSQYVDKLLEQKYKTSYSEIDSDVNSK